MSMISSTHSPPKLSTTNGSDSCFSYASYSSFQRGALDAVEAIIFDAVSEKLDTKHSSFDADTNSIPSPFRIADFGCSIGPNTFAAVRTIIAAALQNHHRGPSPEFHVFFNDHVDNDFNALLRSLPAPPPSGSYYAAAAPGSFHGRVFPAATLHASISSYALQWLSRVPPGVAERGSAAFNQGSVMCTGLVKGVAEAYAVQYAADMERFLTARAAEMVGGGVMVLLLLGLPDGVLLSQTSAGMTFDLLGLCLRDMAKERLICEEKVESFNLPLHYASIGELERVVEENGHFSIERMEPISNPIMNTSPEVQTIVSHLRAAMEGLIKQHFGSEMIDELFQRYAAKLADNLHIYDEENRKNIYIFLLLNRKEHAVANKATKLGGASAERDCRREMEHCEESKRLSTDGETQILVQPKILHESHHPKLLPMKGGDGPFSYAHNSSYQRELVESARSIVAGAILEKLDINSSPSFDPSSNPIRIVDFGCSVGPNTFVAIENIINALNLKYMRESMHLNPNSDDQIQKPEFQVFFNDLIENDFNTLFRTLPSPPACSPYFPNGVPGSFRHRLFPKSTLHVAHSANSLLWLSQIPENIRDPTSVAFNRSHVYCSGTVREVAEEFSGQFEKDLRAFMGARAEELVGGGLLVLHFGCYPKGVAHSETSGGMAFEILGTCLMDMANKGLLSVEKVESFNIPLYFPTAEEVEILVDEFTDLFTVIGIEKLTELQKYAVSEVQTITLHVRAAMEGFLMQHFRDDNSNNNSNDNASFVEELFQRFSEKLADNRFIFDVRYRKGLDLFVLLRRNL